MDALVAAAPEGPVAAANSLMDDVRAGAEPDILGDSAANRNLFEPVVDGEVLGAVPLDAIATGSAAGVDLMVGTTAEEWRLWRFGRLRP